MPFEIWEQLNAPTKYLIEIGAIAAALSAIWGVVWWIWPRLKCGYQRIQWIMQAQVEFTIILERLDIITAKLTPNGGSHMPDQLRRIEDHMRLQGARQQASQHLNPNPVFESNSKGEMTFVNTAYKKFFGIDSKDALGMGWVNIIDPACREKTVIKWFKAIKDKRNFDENVRLLDHDGTSVNAHIIAYVIRGEADEVLGHQGEISINVGEFQ